MNIKRVISDLYLRFKHAFKIKKPIFLIRLIKNYISIIIFKRQPLKLVDFAIDYRCNLKCDHCFATVLSKPKETRKMQVKDYERVVKEAMKLGALDFDIQGGEVFLFPDFLKKIIKACQPKKNLMAITTNATVLDEKTIIQLIKMGIDHITISLDSFIAEEHDEFRKVKGTFKKAMEVIKIAKKHKLNIMINTTLSHNNIRSKGIQKLIDFTNDNKILLNAILAAPAGSWNACQEYMLTKNDLIYLENLRKKYPFLRRDMDANYTKWGCGGGNESLYITPYGDVFVCPFIHISFGNIFEESLKNIRKRVFSNPYFNHYHKKCLASEDHDFIKKHMSRTFGKNNLPISYDEGFK